MSDESNVTADEQAVAEVESQTEDSSVDETVAETSDLESDESGKTGDSSVDDAHWRQELKRKNTENQNLRARAKNAELKVMKFEAAVAAGLPPELAPRLQGSTVEELAEDAKNFLNFVGRRGAPGGLPNNGRSGESSGDSGEPSLDEIGKRMYRI